MPDRARSDVRRLFSTDQRVELLEDDLDKNDDAFAALTKAVNRLTGVLVGAIISFASSAVALVYSIATRR